ncbi:hypothetical protein, partial [Mariniphaga sp.]|uniref:hypothetical protein n=1 Tax=Mariniphaga sp. TaxID=1954475 RepID=UPI00356240B3
ITTGHPNLKNLNHKTLIIRNDFLSDQVAAQNRKKKDSDLQSVKKILQNFDVRINSTGFERNINESTDRVTFLVGVTEKLDVKQLADVLEHEPGVVSISVEIIH